MCRMVYFFFLLQFIDAFSYFLAGIAELFIGKFQIFLGKAEQAEQVQFRMVLLPELKGDKGDEVTCKYAVDSVIFGNNSLTEHARILVLALLVDGDGMVGDKIVPRVNDPVMRVETVPFIVYVVAQHIQAPSDRNGNVGTLCKEL